MDIDTFTKICRNAHEMNYKISSEGGYATAEEMEIHRTVPLAMYELVADYVIALTGYTIEHGHIYEVEAEYIAIARDNVAKHFSYIFSR